MILTISRNSMKNQQEKNDDSPKWTTGIHSLHILWLLTLKCLPFSEQFNSGRESTKSVGKGLILNLTPKEKNIQKFK